MADLSTGEYQRILDLTVAILDNDEPDLPWRLILDEVRVSLASATSLLFWTQGWVDAPPDDFPVPHREPRASPRSAPPPSPLPTRSMGPDLDAQFHRHPLVRHYQVAPDPMPRTVEDLHRDGRWPDEAAQHAVTEYLEADRHLAVPLPAPPGEGRVIVLGRAGRGFTDRDRHLAARWQPLLAAALNQQRQIDRWRAQASAAQGVPPEAVSRYRLTPREVAVLTLLGDALTATAIARRLTISPRTVHRHIDSIYRKLRTNDRLATVLRARDEGLLADPNRPSGRPEA